MTTSRLAEHARRSCAWASGWIRHPPASGWRCWPLRSGPPPGGWASACWMARTSRSALLALAALALLLWACRRRLRAAPRLGWLALALAGGRWPPPPRWGRCRRSLSSLLGLLALGAGLAAFLPRQRLHGAGARPVAALAAPARLAAVLRRLPACASSPPRPAAGCWLPASRWSAAAPACWWTAGWSSSTRPARACRCCGWAISLPAWSRCMPAARNAGFLARLPAVSALVLAGNVLRNAVLVAARSIGPSPGRLGP